jgi:4-amino-4-deoxy-L-arabinose transferase-like glycosyltransferase
LLLASPVFLWNASHQWASFGHVGKLAGAQQTLRLSWHTALEFLGGQLAVLTPLLGAFAWAAPVAAWRSWRRDRAQGETGLFLACFCAPVLVFFLLLSCFTEVYANWTGPAYPAALALMAGWLETRRSGAGGRIALGWARGALALGAVLTLVVHLAAAGWFFALPPKAESSLDRVRGWSDLGAETARRLAALPTGEHAPVLGARRYQIASLLSFYVPGHPEVQLFPDRTPAGNQYRFWDRSDDLRGRDVLFVCEDGWEAEHLRALFASVEPLPPFVQRRQGRVMREVRYYLCRRFAPEGAVGVAWGPAREARP